MSGGMSRARAEESRPQYFGGDLRAYRSEAGLRLSEIDYGSARRWAPHTHWRAFFALLLRGSYVESLGRTSLDYDALDLGFHPESTEHTDRIAADDTRFFLIELDESWMRRLRELGGQAALAPRMCGGRTHALALRLYREFRSGRAHSEESDSESLVLELFAGLLPRGAARTPPSWLATVLDILRSEYPTRLSLVELARQVRLHPVYLSRAFRDHVGRSVSQCVTEARIRYAARRLADPSTTLAEVALDAGFADQSHFTRVFKRETGMTPGAYRPRRKARTSAARSSGSSIAAKWPPRGISVQRTTS
jgi:AraC family transcriptional regulator